MGKKNILFTCCLVGAISFSSCEKNLYDESKQPEKETKMTDLEIPADFDWKLTQVAKGTTSANTQTMVSLFLDEKCSEDEKVATIPVYKEAISLPLSIPTYVKTLYAQYQSTSGKKITKPVAVNADGSYTLNITDAAEVIPTRAITRGDDYDIEDDILYIKGEGAVYHPSSGWGTIMFEDQFPSLGDYDFNDFVVNYKVLFEVGKEKADNKYKSKYIAIGLRLKAIGGIFPYTPYLRLEEIENKDVKSITMTYYKTGEEEEGEEIEINRINNKSSLIIDCSPLIQNLNKRGSKYFNTEKNALVATNDLPQITIEIELREPKEVDEILDDDDFDLYLRRDNGIEIHMNGIEPVAYDYPFDNENLLPVYKEDDNYYLSKEKLIWGLRVPDNINHAIEEVNFLKAYENFATWAEHKGEEKPDWYQKGVNKDLLIYN